MSTIQQHLEQALNERKAKGALRRLKVLPGCIDFCSNDYLGFSSTGILRKKIQELDILQHNQTYEGSTGSRLISGNSAFVEELESDIAAYHRSEAALLFNSGYDANIGLFSCVPKRGDVVFYDELVHASIRDGIRLSHAKAFSFRHNDIAHLEELFRLAHGNVFVAVESVYSMDGDKAPLNELAVLCAQHNANLIVDEAHATGVFGVKGRGCVSESGLEDIVFARVHTYGKALGTHGAAVLGNSVLRDYLINFARSFIYTTALPYHSLLAIKSAYALLEESDAILVKLKENIMFFTSMAQQSGRLELIESNSPIQSVIISGNENVVAAAMHIQQQGFDVRPIMSPTVPAGAERLRVCMHAFNTKEEIRRLVELMVEWCRVNGSR